MRDDSKLFEHPISEVSVYQALLASYLLLFSMIHIGCGSWADPEYVGALYPKGLPAKDRLAEYARHFDRVELNSTYYATPAQKVVANWAVQTPAKFTFDVKLHKEFSQN